ncbi:MAG: cohesin domain-containing protein [Candidatus Eisenbacteria bacterium]
MLSDATGNSLAVTNQSGSISVTGGGGAASPVVSVTAPNGGEQPGGHGSQHPLHRDRCRHPVEPAHHPLRVLDQRRHLVDLISDAQSNSGSFAWTVPNSASTQCRARVTASDGVRTGNDASDQTFAITAAPAGSNVLAVGTGTGASGGEVTIPLTLDNDDPIKALQTDLHFTSSILSYEASAVGDHAPGMQLAVNLVDAGTLRIVMHYENSSVIAAGSGTIANVTFSLLAAGTSPVTPQASVLSNPAGQAVSVTEQAGSVTVTGGGGGQAPSITLIAPNGGQTLSVGAATTINWSATDPDTPANDLRVTIEYSINGAGGPFIPISNNEANDGAFQWTVPNTPASTCRVKLTVTDGALTASDLSNADFTIQGTGTTSNTLSLGTGTGASGTQVVIPVSLDNGDVVKALQFDVAFTGSVVSFASVAGTGRGATLNASSRALGSGGVRIVLDYRDATTLSAGNGTIANLTFNLVGASGTSTNLTVSNLLISDPAAQAVESDALDGSINVQGGGGNGPTLDLFALKNPARTRTLQIFLRSNQPLTQNPTVSAGSSNVTMTLIDAGENLYQGAIAVNGGASNLTINAQGQSAGGTGTKTLTVNF